jgi:hypothetical protein
LSGPGGGSGNPDHDPEKGVTVTLGFEAEALAKRAAGSSAAAAGAVRPVDSASVRITGPGMDTLRFGFRLGGAVQSLSLLDVPPGDERRFEIGLLQGGRVLYKGATTVALRTEAANAVTVSCQPEFSRLTASIHVPADFPKGVAGGLLRVWNESGTLSAPATANGELRNFRLEEVPGDRDYEVSLALWSAAGDTVATARRSGLRIPKGQSVALVMPLTLAYTRIALAMTVDDPAGTTITLTLPGGRRTPTAFGDAVFSEFYAAPATDEGGDNAEWIEVFNRMGDTLDLAGCQITRDAGTSTGMNFAFPAGASVAPGRGFVLGRSAVAFAHLTQASALNLVNSASRLELSCPAATGGVVRVDTLRYTTSTTDTLAARMSSGKVTTLRPSRLASRHKADAWCLSTGKAGAAPAAGETAATPGGIAGGCGEE